jgi:mRNA interferase MazF
VPFPFTDLSTTKRRPAVVLWSDVRQTDFTLAFISSQNFSNLGVDELVLLPTHPEFPLTGLTVASKIRAAKLVTLSRHLFRRWLGRLGPLLTADLDRTLIVALGINTIPAREEGRWAERERLVALYNVGGSPALLADLGVTPDSDDGHDTLY